MLEHDQQRTAHEQDAFAPAPVQEVTPAVEAQAPAKTVPPAASFAELTGQEKEVTKAAATVDAPLANVDAMIEQLAHGMVAKELDDKDEHFLHANGYKAMPIIRGAHEFVMRTFVPTQAGKPPIVAFRGTVPTKVQTVLADLDPRGIGVYQFNPNRALIDAQMANAASFGAIVSAGHSLGGALAQIAAAAFPDRVGRIVTFQAPGVSVAAAKTIADYNAANPDKAIESDHHRVEGDLVPYGGQALTPGMIHNHKMTGGSMLSRNPLSKHVSMPLAQEEMAAGHEVPIHGDHGSVADGDVTTEYDNEHKTKIIDKIRAGIGHVIGVGGLYRN